MALIARLYDPTEGAVLVDGADVRTVDSALAALARSPSSPTTASCSLRRSPRTSPTRARTRAREEIEIAARRAQADGFISELPDGYDTVVGERGLTLSGGQRQRVAIARALLADPRILILDDATSSVDATTERTIKEGLREVMAGRTTLVIAHRLSTVSLADEVVVLDGGRIVDRGAHDELLDRCGFYAEIAEHGLRRLGLPAARPRAARGDGEAVSGGTGTGDGAIPTTAASESARANCAGPGEQEEAARRSAARRSAPPRRSRRSRPPSRSATGCRTSSCFSRRSGGCCAARTSAAARCAGWSACCVPTGAG